MKIQFFNDDVSWRLRKKRSVREWIISVAEKEGFSVGEINIIFVSDNSLLKINKEFLGHDYFTDIITFGGYSDGVISGELYISIDSVRNNARELGVTMLYEMQRVIIHGILHMCGYNDLSGEEKNNMRRLEDFYLSFSGKV